MRRRAVGKPERRRTPRRPTGGRPDGQTDRRILRGTHTIVHAGNSIRLGGMNGERDGTRRREAYRESERERESVRVSSSGVIVVCVSFTRRRGTIISHIYIYWFSFRMHSARASRRLWFFLVFISSPIAVRAAPGRVALPFSRHRCRITITRHIIGTYSDEPEFCINYYYKIYSTYNCTTYNKVYHFLR